MSAETFNYLYCRNGHMLYGRGSISDGRCQRCGESFLAACENCGAKLCSSFISHTYFTSGEPVDFPSRPDFCRQCGTRFPWYDETLKIAPDDFWARLHPSVAGVARKRFEDGHLADAVEAVLKALNQAVKQIVKQRTGQEYDGATLMRHAFSPKNPVIVLDDLSADSGRDAQQGYMDIFAGTMTGIRNPKAHDIVTIDEARAIHHLYLASLLFYKLDERR